MSLIRIDRSPSRRQLAVFAAAWLVFFGVLGGLALRRGDLAWAAGLWTAAVLVPALGWAVPAWLRIVYVGTAYAALPIGWVVSHLVLAMIYYFVLTPTALLMRVLGYDPMNRRFDPQAGSYWVPREEPDDVTRYFRQF